jgi:hypothetical protein
VRWNTQQAQTRYTVPELPYGVHKIKWFVEDGCGNEETCEYMFEVKDCKKPTVVCINGLSVNIMPTKMITLNVGDFLQYTEDNCTPSNRSGDGIRKAGQARASRCFRTAQPQKTVTFDCSELGQQNVEVWSMRPGRQRRLLPDVRDRTGQHDALQRQRADRGRCAENGDGQRSGGRGGGSARVRPGERSDRSRQPGAYASATVPTPGTTR